MLLKNKFFSTLYFYLIELENNIRHGQNLNTVADSHLRESEGKIICRLDSFKTSLCFSSNIVLKEIAYKGYLEFIYDDDARKVLVTHVPYVQYAEVKVPLFTSDLVKLMINVLDKYGASSACAVEFKDSSAILTIDENATHLLPSLKDTKNYVLLQRLTIALEKEKKKIDNDVLRYRQKSKREEASREYALIKKRKIHGIDPNAFENNQQFIDFFSKQLCDTYEKKIANIKRHIASSKCAYKKLLESSFVEEEIQLFEDLKVAFENVFKASCVFWGSDEDITFKDYENFLDLSFHYNEELIDKIILFLKLDWGVIEYLPDEVRIEEFHVYLESIVKQVRKAIEKIRDYAQGDDKKIKIMLEKYNYRGQIEALLQRDCSENSVLLDILNEAEREVDRYKGHKNVAFEEELTPEEKELWYRGNGFPMMVIATIERRVRNTYDTLETYHPIFCGTINTWESEHDYHRLYEGNFELIRKASNILLQILALTTQLHYYEDLINNPLKVTERFTKESNVWGNVMRLPYFLRKDIDKFDYREKFNLLMIKPGVEEIDLSTLKYFSADYGKKFGRRQTERIKFYQSEAKMDSCSRLMICIPHTLKVEGIVELIAYAYKNGKLLNFVVDNPDRASLLKSLLVEMEFQRYINSTSIYEPREVMVNVDSNYYDNFMVSTPSNKIFWHKYDYSSSYKYHRKHAVDFGYQVTLAIEFLLGKQGSEVSLDAVKRLILGDYLENEDIDYLAYQRALEEIDAYVASGRDDSFTLSQKTQRYIFKTK